MNLQRVRQDIAAAQQKFFNVERHATRDGGVYVRAALQTLHRPYMLTIEFPHTYPNEMPHVFVRTPVLNASAPHRYTDGRICFLHPSMWNPGRHNLVFVIKRAAKWLNKYEVWLHTGRWPGKQVEH